MSEIYGICDKCGTEHSLLKKYQGAYLCSANLCYTEEVERDSGRHVRKEKKLRDYKNIIARSG